jgi:hypothetical protein
MSDILAEAYQKGRADLLAELRSRSPYYFDMSDNLDPDDRGVESWQSVSDYCEDGLVFEVEEHIRIATVFVACMDGVRDNPRDVQRFETEEAAQAWIAQRQLELDAQDD